MTDSVRWLSYHSHFAVCRRTLSSVNEASQEEESLAMLSSADAYAVWCIGLGFLFWPYCCSFCLVIYLLYGLLRLQSPVHVELLFSVVKMQVLNLEVLVLALVRVLCFVEGQQLRGREMRFVDTAADVRLRHRTVPDVYNQLLWFRRANSVPSAVAAGLNEMQITGRRYCFTVRLSCVHRMESNVKFCVY